MNRIIKQSEVAASSKLAARLGQSGTREERSGQSGGSPADITMRLRNEVRIATLNWATVEAFNSTFETLRDGLIEWNAWQPAMFGVRSIARDVIMALMRITDGPGQDNDLETVSRLVDAFDGMTAGEIAATTGATEEAITAGLEYLQARVPLGWGKNHVSPGNSELADMRMSFKPIRDNLIAHAKVYSTLDLRRDMPKVRTFLLLISSLSDAACMVCNVPRDDLQERWDTSVAEAKQFWGIVAAASQR